MSLAAIVNPQKESEALAFSYQGEEGKKNLVVQQVILNENEETIEASNFNTSEVLKVVDKPEFAVANFGHQVRVFGFVKHSNKSEKSKIVAAQLSPVFTPIDNVESIHSPHGNGIAACGHPRDRFGHVFFLVLDKSPCLYHYTLTTTPSAMRIASKVWKESKLAALHRGGAPWVFYQDHEMLIRVISFGADEKINTISSQKAGCHLSALNMGKSGNIDYGVALCYETEAEAVNLVSFKGTWSTEESVLSSRDRDEGTGFSLVGGKDQVYLLYWTKGTLAHKAIDIRD